MKRVYKDYQSLVGNLDSTFDGQVILPEDAFDTDELKLKFVIKPNDGVLYLFMCSYLVDYQLL